MLNIFFYFNLMFIMYVIIFIFSLSLYYLDLGFMLEWTIFSFNSVNIEFLVLVDWMSMLFISFICLISSMIMLYSYIYMYINVFIERFIYLVMLFIFSMILMIISPNVISILFGWDGLGLVSYCLVIYYQNYMSYNSGMVTVLCNRIGDIGLMLGISLGMMKGSWSWMTMKEMSLIIFMLLLAGMTKSAQVPFSVWLPMAMAAPTPVSALVHSSTLVTAGVYLMIRFNKFLLESKLSVVLLFFSVLTMLISGTMATVENDLKKIIALSTLSQLGLMMMILSLGLSVISFYHLLTHAVFKSMLFMCAGVIIHTMYNNQDIRLFGNMNELIPYVMMSFYISNLALCGFPFMAGFYSKDFIMELVYNNQLNLFLLIFICLSLMFTVMYSFRLFYYMFFGHLKFYSYHNMEESKLMNFSMMMLITLSISVGSLLNWMFFYDFYLVFLSDDMKTLTLLLCLIALLMMVIYIFIKCVRWYCLLFYLSGMWHMVNFYWWAYSPFINSGVFSYKIDLSWMEYSMKNMVISYLKKYMKMVFFYKMYMMMFLFSYLIVLIWLIY